MEWIKISERKPEDGVTILISDGLVVLLAYAWYDDFDRDHALNFSPDDRELETEIGNNPPQFYFKSNEITHWMPLPEPPK